MDIPPSAAAAGVAAALARVDDGAAFQVGVAAAWPVPAAVRAQPPTTRHLCCSARCSVCCSV